MNPNLMHALTGLKKGGTHRGKRSRGKGPKPTVDHKAALDKAHAAGDHAGIKSAALMLAKAAHKAHTASQPAVLTPDAKALI